jgi:phosphopentomutase
LLKLWLLSRHFALALAATEQVAKSGTPMSLPTMEKLGLTAAAHLASGEWATGFTQREGFTAAYGAARERSTGKDTQSGRRCS